MSSSTPRDGVRALPARPNLEFERKRAKKSARTSGGTIALAEAQLSVAREYGFASWRKLVAYYTMWGQQQLTAYPGMPSGGFEHSVRAILAECAERRTMATQPPDIHQTAAAAAKYIPRCFGLTDAEIFASDITEDEIRLLVARRFRFGSWKELTTLQEAHTARLQQPESAEERERHETRMRLRAPGPIRLDDFADGADDRERILHLLAHGADLQYTPRADMPYDAYAWRLMFQASMGDSTPARAARDALRTAHDLQSHLNYALLGRPGFGHTTEYVQGLLDLGADPTWMPPNGRSVLEHAIALYRNGNAVDLVAQRVSPRASFWVAAGLGDVATLRRFINPRGVLSDAARRDRLDMTALGGHLLETGRPDASDRDITWEAFLVAGLNSRLDTMQALLDTGLPVDHTPHRYTMLHIAIAESNLAVVQFLLDSGADPDFRAIASSESPRDMAAAAGGGDGARADALLIRRLLA